MNERIRAIFYKSFHSAYENHPEFAESPEQAICVITEEFGELAKEILEKKDEWEYRAIIEASHVAVTAIRLMEMMMYELNGYGCKECEVIQILTEDRTAKCKKHEKMRDEK